MPLSRFTFVGTMGCAIGLIGVPAAVDVAILRDPTTVRLRTDDLILSDISTEDQSLDRAYAAGFQLSKSLSAGESLFVKFWGGVDRAPLSTPNPLDFHIRIYFDRGDGGSPSNQINSSGLHTFRQVLDLQATGTQLLDSAPAGINLVWNEYRAEITLDQDLAVNTRYWLESGERDFATNVLDRNQRMPFYLLPSMSSDGNPSSSRRDPWDGTTWFGSNPAAIQIYTEPTIPVPEPMMLTWSLVLGGGGICGFRRHPSLTWNSHNSSER